MTKRRIVKEIYKDDTVQYRVEKYIKFVGWHTETRTLSYYMTSWKEPVRFSTLEQAKEYCGVPTNPIVSEEIIEI